MNKVIHELRNPANWVGIVNGPVSYFLTNMCSANWDLIHHMSNSLEPNGSLANCDFNIMSNQLNLIAPTIWNVIAHVKVYIHICG